MQSNRSYPTDTTASKNAVYKPVPITAIQLTDRFWAPRLEINRTVSLRQQYQKLVDTGRLDNFLRVAGRCEKSFTGHVFNDTDVYKWLEAVAWSLASAPDPELEDLADDVIDIVVAAQDENGYLNTYFSFDRKEERWSNIRDLHELYSAGHMFQAAIALHRCTGDTRLLKSAQRFADYLVKTFGSVAEEAVLPPGHPEVEMALVELYRETGHHPYLDLAVRFVDSRGKGRIGGREYHLDHQPFRELTRLTGHAVRALYLAAGGADMALEMDDDAMHTALKRLWNHLVNRQMYITGGVGAHHQGESIGADYELPNARAYAETCASIAAVMWAWRMLLKERSSQYADDLEHILYNGVLPGVSLDGSAYFYTNPLSDDGTHQREAWFGCACCPPNLARMLAMMPGFIYTATENAIWVHQYVANEAKIPLADNQDISILQRTRYPWDGNVIIEILNTCSLDLYLRIPSWCNDEVEININGELYRDNIIPGHYVRISRKWVLGDSVCIQFPMRVRTVEAHPYVRENTGQVALMRGPILYCVETADHPDVNLLDLVLHKNQSFTSVFDPKLLGGVQVIKANAMKKSPGIAWREKLYLEQQSAWIEQNEDVALVAVPYFAWGNRIAGQMLVWLKQGGAPERYREER